MDKIWLIAVGTIWGLLTDILGIALGAWTYGIIALQIPIWLFVWWMVVELVREKAYHTYAIVGFVFMAVEMLGVGLNHLTYLFPATYKIIIGSSYLPVLAVFGWPLTAFLLCYANIDVQKKHGHAASAFITVVLAIVLVFAYLAIPL